jgi:hypothetical protein
VANPFESDWGFRRCGLVFAAPGPPTAVHLPSPPPLPPSPHALPMRFPGRVSGEGLEKPRPDRDGSPGWPGGWNAEVSSGRIPWARLVRLRGEDPRGKPGMGLGRPRGKAPGSTWGEEGNGSRKPGERGARSDGSRRRWPTPTASIRRLQTRKGFPQGFPASGRNPSTPNFLAPKNRSDFFGDKKFGGKARGKPGKRPGSRTRRNAQRLLGKDCARPAEGAMRGWG